VNKTAFDFMPILQGIEAVKSSGLTKEQKDSILSEMAAALPPPVFCRACPQTLAIFEELLGVSNGAKAQQTPQDKPKEATDKPEQGTPEGQSKLLRETDGNRGGKGTSSPVVNKTSQKRRSPKRNT